MWKPYAQEPTVKNKDARFHYTTSNIFSIPSTLQSLLTRVAETAVGASTILRCGVMQQLAACTFFEMRPQVDRYCTCSVVTCTTPILSNPNSCYLRW